MPKKKGAIAAKARARREQRDGENPASVVLGPVVPADGRRVRRGLSNLGNSCYMNSVLQCLNVAVPFSDDLMEMTGTFLLEGIPGSLCATFHGMRGTEGTKDAGSGVFAPKALFADIGQRFPWYKGRQQHDADEFLHVLLGSVSDDCLALAKAQGLDSTEADVAIPDHVARNFRGQLCAATLCWGCGGVSVALDPFLVLPLHLPALRGQQKGFLGLTSTMLSGKELPPDEATNPESASGSTEDTAAPAPAQLQGAWAAARAAADKAANREYVAAYVERLLVRKLLAAEAAEAAVAAAAEATAADDDASHLEVEVEIRRRRSPGPPTPWGFLWNELRLSANDFILSGVMEDSPLDRWNLRCRTMGDDELVLRPGDRLLEGNGFTSHTDLVECLRSETVDALSLRFERGAGSASMESAPSQRSATEVQEEERQAAREAARQDLVAAATARFEALPVPVQAAFGPAPEAAGGRLRLTLEDCMRHFSGVDMVEDSYKPVYRCTKCWQKEAPTKTFASRRMWLWPAGLPPLLTLQLKRFRRYGDELQKSVASVALPVLLDLSDHVADPDKLRALMPYVTKGADLLERALAASVTAAGPTYELYGIIVHEGTSMKAGHYIAYVNAGPSLEREQWYSISDGKLTRCSREEMLSAEAYVAFYRRLGDAGN